MNNKPILREAGHITTHWDGGPNGEYKYAILITFDSAEAFTKAMKAKTTEWDSFGENGDTKP